MLTLFKSKPDQRGGDEGAEDYVELVVTGEDTAEALETAEESFDVIALAIDHLVQFPRLESLRMGRDYWLEAKQAGQAASLVTRVGHIHRQSTAVGGTAQIAHQFAAFGAVPVLAGGEAEADGVDIIRGNQMNLGVPTTAGFTDGLRPVFFSA